MPNNQVMELDYQDLKNNLVKSVIQGFSVIGII